jgi:plasmid stabilization system protein ParE
MNILLTKRAEQKYLSIKQYIIDEFGENVAQAFEQKTIDLLLLLKSFPTMGSLEFPEKDIYGFQLTKQTRIFYRIKKENIIILTFFDVRQSPKKRLK